MKIRFWGTRGAIPTPGPGTIRFGGNTSCVALTTDNGELLIFDCGTGAYPLGTALMAQGEKAIRANILIGNTYWDHIQGFPSFSPAFVSGNSFAIYGPEGNRSSLHDVLAGQMEYIHFPVELNQLPAAITCHDLSESIHTIGGARVATQFLNHPTMTLGYRVKVDGVVVVYLVDHEPFSDALWRAGAEPGRIESILHEGDRRHAKFMADADLVIHDAQYTPEEYVSKKTWGHSTYDYVVQIAAAAGVRRVALTHHDPSHDDEFVADIERKARSLALQRGTGLDVFCAYEGCELVLEARSTLKPFVTADPFQASVAQRRFHILVVDDQPDTLMMIVRALEDDHYTVSKATTGPEALRMIDERMPDLVVLDYKMKGMDGLAVVKTLRAKPATQLLRVLGSSVMAVSISTGRRCVSGLARSVFMTARPSMPAIM